MRAHRLGDLVADAVHRVEAADRVLEDHGDLVAAEPAQLGLGQCAGDRATARSGRQSTRPAAERARAGGSRPMTARPVSVLPEPLSPTSARVSPGATAKRHVAHRADRVARGSRSRWSDPRHAKQHGVAAGEASGRTRDGRAIRASRRRPCGARIQHVAQPVAEHVQRQDGAGQREAGPEQQPAAPAPWSRARRGSSAPRTATGGTTPRPRKDRPLSSTIAAATVSENCTSSGGAMFGRMRAQQDAQRRCAERLLRRHVVEAAHRRASRR